MEERQTKVILIFLCVIFLSVLHETRAVIVLRWNAAKTTLEARYDDDKWGEVCAQYTKPNQFNDKAANVSCRQMGFLHGKVHPDVVQANKSAIVLEEVICPTGEESSLSKCQVKPANASSKCPLNLATKVECTKDPALDGLLNAGIRDRDEKAHEGIVHVTKDGKEGDVCYDATTADAVAKVVCKQMGYSGSIKQTPVNTSSSTNFYTAKCTKGTEETLAACTLSTATTCSSGKVTNVQCRLDKATQRRFDIRLSSPNNSVESVEVYQYGRWGVICDTDWDIHDAEVVCRELGYKSAQSKETGAKFGQGTGVVFWNKMQCNAFEPSIANCIKDVALGTQTCDSADAAGVVCNTERIYTINICSNGPKVLEAGYTMIQSEAQPKPFSYSKAQTCFLNLTSQTDFTVYIYKKMFEENHVEYLSFISADRNETLYGDDSRQGPFDFSSRRLTIEFNADTASGSGVINIMVSVAALPEPPTTLAAVTTTTNGMIGGIVGAVATITIIILVFVLWKKGLIKTNNRPRRYSSVGSDEKNIGGQEGGVLTIHAHSPYELEGASTNQASSPYELESPTLGSEEPVTKGVGPQHFTVSGPGNQEYAMVNKPMMGTALSPLSPKGAVGNQEYAMVNKSRKGLPPLVPKYTVGDQEYAMVNKPKNDTDGVLLSGPTVPPKLSQSGPTVPPKNLDGPRSPDVPGDNLVKDQSTEC